LGCGATIHRAISEGAHVTYIAFSTVEESVPDGYPKDQLKKELKKATASLGILEENLIIFKYTVRKLNYVRQEILEELIKIRNERQVDMVFMPVLDDIHQDHSTIAAEGLRAFKQASIMGYELMWNNIEFRTNAFISISQENLNAKINALQLYESQRNRRYMNADFIQSLATVRGVQCGKTFAEAFEIIRWII
jgi:LmbE family N-acetylglucosaminyl deacetylase